MFGTDLPFLMVSTSVLLKKKEKCLLVLSATTFELFKIVSPALDCIFLWSTCGGMKLILDTLVCVAEKLDRIMDEWLGVRGKLRVKMRCK